MVGQANAGFAQNQSYAQGLTHANPLSRYEHNLGAGIPGGNAFMPGGAHAAQAAPGIMGGMKGAATGMGFGVSLGAAFGVLPRMLDPFTQSIHTVSGAYARGGVASAIGAGAGVAGAYLAVGQAATYMTGKIMQGAQEQAHSQGMFSANLGNSGISGMGGMGGMQGASDAIQGISSMGTSAGLGGNINVSSVGNVMAMGMQGGQFRGVRGAAQFKQRLSKLTAEATAMANMLGSSIEEASSTLQGIEQQFGLKGSSAISFVGQMGAMQGASGMGVTQQMAQAQFGSGMFQSMGLGRAQGARYGVGLAQRVGSTVQMGAVGRNAMADIGGQEQATARFTQSAVQIFSGRAGMRLLGAMMDENGELDTSMAFRIAQGSMSKSDINKEYKKRIKGKGGRGMLLANRAEMIGEFMEDFGPEGALSAAEGFNAGSDDSEFKNLAMSGLTGKEMDVLRNMRGQAGNLRKQMYDAARRGLAKSPMQGKSVSDILGGMVTKVMQPVEEIFTGWGRDIHTAVSGMLDDISRDIAGKGPGPRQGSGVKPGGMISRGMGAAFAGGAVWAGHQSAFGQNSAYQAGLNKFTDSTALQGVMSAADSSWSPTFGGGGGAPSALPDEGASPWTPDWDRMEKGHQSTTALGGLLTDGMRYSQRGGDPSGLDNWGMLPSLWGAEEPSDLRTGILRGVQAEGLVSAAPGIARAGMRARAFHGGANAFKYTMAAEAGAAVPYSRALGGLAATERGGKFAGTYNWLGKQMGQGGLTRRAGSLLSWGAKQIFAGRDFMAKGDYMGKAGKLISKAFQNTGWMKFGGRGALGSIGSMAGWATKAGGAALGAVGRVAGKVAWPLMALEPIAILGAELSGGPGESGNFAQGLTGGIGDFAAAMGGMGGFGGEGSGYAPAGTGYDANLSNEAKFTFMGTQSGQNEARGSGNRVWVGTGSGGGGSERGGITRQMWIDTGTLEKAADFALSGIYQTESIVKAFGGSQTQAMMVNDLKGLTAAYESQLSFKIHNSPVALESKAYQRLQEDTYMEVLGAAASTGTPDGSPNSPAQVNTNWTNVIKKIAGKDYTPSERRLEVRRLMQMGGASSARMKEGMSIAKNMNLTYKPGMTGKALKSFQARLLAGTAAQIFQKSYGTDMVHEAGFEKNLAEYRAMTKLATSSGAADDRYTIPLVGPIFTGGVDWVSNWDDENLPGGEDAVDVIAAAGLDPDDFPKLDPQGTHTFWGFTSVKERDDHHQKRFRKLGTALYHKRKMNIRENKTGYGLMKSLGIMGVEGKDTGSQAVQELILSDPDLANRLMVAGGNVSADDPLFTRLSKVYEEGFMGGITDKHLHNIPEGLKYKGTTVTEANLKTFARQELKSLFATQEGKNSQMTAWSFTAATYLTDALNKEQAIPVLNAMRAEDNSYHAYTSATGLTIGQAVKDSGGSAKAGEIADRIMETVSKGIKTDSTQEPYQQIQGLHGDIAQEVHNFRREMANMSGEDLLATGEALMNLATSSNNSQAMELAQVAIGMGGFKVGRSKGEKKKPGSVASMGKSAARMLGLKSADELSLVGIGKGSKAKRIREYIKENKALPLSSQLALEKVTMWKMANQFGQKEMKEGGGAKAMAHYQLDVVQRRVYGTGAHSWFDPAMDEGKGGYTTDVDTAGLDDEDMKRADVMAAGDIGQRLGRGGKAKGGQKTDAHVASIISNIEGLDGAIAGFITRLTGSGK